jgi:hypothetical protein
MMKRLLAIAFFLILASPAIAVENDFDKVCSYFDKLEVQVTKSTLSKTQKKEYVDALVKKYLQPDSPARQAWEVVLYGAPEVRYELFKTAAEETTRKKWDCKSMEKLLPTTGK